MDTVGKKEETASLLEVCGVGKSYRGRKRGRTAAVRGVCFSLKRGRCLGVVGESGCGKSTLCRIIAGIEKPDFGEIRYCGAPADYKKDRQKIQMVFQNSMDAVNLHLNAEKIISEPLENFFSMDREGRRREASRLMELVGLSPEDMGKYPKQFSGGQLQRICIARALAAKPELLILDEPLSSLDVSVQAQLLNLLKDLQEKLGLTCILVSHDLEAVYYLADGLAVMYGGALVETLSDIEALSCLRHPYARKLLSVCREHGAEDFPFARNKEHMHKSGGFPGAERGAEDGEFPGIGEARGCVYAGCCPEADEVCLWKTPELSDREPGHRVACHHV